MHRGEENVTDVWNSTFSALDISVSAAPVSFPFSCTDKSSTCQRNELRHEKTGLGDFR